MSALPLKADIGCRDPHVRFVPKADITHTSWRLPSSLSHWLWRALPWRPRRTTRTRKPQRFCSGGKLLARLGAALVAAEVALTQRRVYDCLDCFENTASLLAKPQWQKSESPRQSSQAVRRCTERQYWRLAGKSCQAAHICREARP